MSLIRNKPLIFLWIPIQHSTFNGSWTSFHYNSHPTLHILNPPSTLHFLGQKGDYFYIIQEGHFKVLVNGRDVSTLEEGKSFGELALLYNTPRAATVRAATPCVVFSLDRDTFRNTLATSSFSKVSIFIAFDDF